MKIKKVLFLCIGCMYLLLGLVFSHSEHNEKVTNNNQYFIDQSHSYIGFKVRHMGIGKVYGKFNKFVGQIYYDPKNLKSFMMRIQIRVDSIDTGVESRDKHLKADDFFDVKKFPNISFSSQKIRNENNQLIAEGELEIKGIRKTIEILLNIQGPVEQKKGKVVGVDIITEINRKDFGISFHKVLDSGVLSISDKVNIELSMEFKQ